MPQCGISGAAATLFSTGSITVGTMLAVFFATSDEMLPILLSSLTESSGISWKAIVLITLSKAALGILLGYLADLLFGRWFRAQKSIHSFCEREHCDCDEEEGSVFLAALRHTLKIAAMLIAVNFALNLLFHYIGVERLSGTILNRPVLGELILALFGLIPNCSVSVVVTESYLSGVLGLGGLFALSALYSSFLTPSVAIGIALGLDGLQNAWITMHTVRVRARKKNLSEKFGLENHEENPD